MVVYPRGEECGPGNKGLAVKEERRPIALGLMHKVGMLRSVRIFGRPRKRVKPSSPLVDEVYVLEVQRAEKSRHTTCTKEISPKVQISLCVFDGNKYTKRKNGKHQYETAFYHMGNSGTIRDGSMISLDVER